MITLGRALIAACLAVIALGTFTPPAAADDVLPPAPVAYVGAGSLRWDQLTPQTTPTLWRLVGDSAVASMSVRSARDVTCSLDAWLTIGAGSKALSAEPTGDRSSLNPGQLEGELPASCPAMPEVNGGSVADWQKYVDLQTDASGAYGRPGTIGEALADAGVCATAIGPGAAVALARTDGSVARYQTEWSRRAQVDCPVTAIDAGDLAGDHEDPTEAELGRIDALVADVIEAAPGGSYVIVSGTTDSEHAPTRPQVAMLYEVGSGEAAWLTSETTRRSGHVHIGDVGATILAAAGVDADQVDARTMTVADERDLSIADTVADREDVAELSTVIPDDGPVFGAWIVAVPLAVMAASLIALIARRRGAAWARHPAFVRIGIVAALFATAIPSALYLATAAQWWHSDHPTITLATVVVAIAAVITGLCLILRWDRPYRFVAVQSGITFAALTVDGVIGTPLQVGSLLAAGPVYGGRFFGFGNVTFVVYAVSAMLVAAVVAQELRRRAMPRAALLSAVGIGLVAIAVDGWPTFGADFGGMLSLVPGVLVLVLLLAGVRLGWGRLVAAAASGALVVALVSYLDYLRPPGERSHFGSFIARVRDGEAWDLLDNKIDALVASFSGPVGWLEIAGFAIGVAAVLRPARLHVPELAGLYDAWPTLRPALIAIVVTCGIGSLVNDSGVLVSGLAVVTVAPPMIATCAWYATRSPSVEEVTAHDRAL
ncbi:hypothetical protein [Solicola gregarius]|uniref:Uncharacterized protein n=1 Tax=Solicola gregarius TaxID=2908642 RepID=A0AA46TMC4_9ACTN|nr:hypothetical protein [Solicola gregarius]UYM07562.1 hypothetical protein L0C25_10965 [Solicola gregarius]